MCIFSAIMFVRRARAKRAGDMAHAVWRRAADLEAQSSLCQYVGCGVESKDAEGLVGIGRVGRDAVAVLGSVFDAPLERIAREDHYTPIMFAAVVEFGALSHHPKGAAAQLRVEIIDGRGDLDPAAFESWSFSSIIRMCLVILAKDYNH